MNRTHYEQSVMDFKVLIKSVSAIGNFRPFFLNGKEKSHAFGTRTILELTVHQE